MSVSPGAKASKGAQIPTAKLVILACNCNQPLNREGERNAVNKTKSLVWNFHPAPTKHTTLPHSDAGTNAIPVLPRTQTYTCVKSKARKSPSPDAATRALAQPRTQRTKPGPAPNQVGTQLSSWGMRGGGDASFPRIWPIRVCKSYHVPSIGFNFN